MPNQETVHLNPVPRNRIGNSGATQILARRTPYRPRVQPEFTKCISAYICEIQQAIMPGNSTYRPNAVRPWPAVTTRATRVSGVRAVHGNARATTGTEWLDYPGADHPTIRSRRPDQDRKIDLPIALGSSANTGTKCHSPFVDSGPIYGSVHKWISGPGNCPPWNAPINWNTSSMFTSLLS